MHQDRIFITQLRIETIIGVHPEERLAPQALLLDIALTTDTRPAAKSDALSNTIDYQLLSNNLVIWSKEKSVALVETLANYLADKILQTTAALSVRLCLSKFPPGIPAASMGVIVVRDRV